MKKALLSALLSCTFITSSALTINIVSSSLALAQTKDDAEIKAEKMLAQMTQKEKIQMVMGYFATNAPWKNFTRHQKSLADSAGFIDGIERLGIPPQYQTDAGVGVATQRSPTPRERTAIPSGIAIASSWNPQIGFDGGALIGKEARLSGFNVMLAGGINLMIDPRNGRNFEYGGEDPLLAGLVIGNAIKGIQSNNIISTLKHFAFNNQETNRFSINVKIDEKAAMQSELLAFRIANEVARPGAVMCAYNRVNEFYACENDWLLNKVLKKEWGFKGYVMSDWGATHSTIPAANNGLDQQSGFPFDKSAYFADPLLEAVDNNHVPQKRLDDMVKRILWAMYDNGLFDNPVNGDQSNLIDFAAHAKITEKAALESIVLLKNENNILPLAKSVKKIAIIGGHADKGVLSGGGSSQVYPKGGLAVPNEGPDSFPGPMVYYPSSPMLELAKLTKAKITYNNGKNIEEAAILAKNSDLVIVFANQWTGESIDAPDLNLPNGGNELISKIADANSKTIVVLQTGGPVVMPWLNKVSGVLEAWYPGTSGGSAIAKIITGAENPSGALSVSFPKSIAQLPRPVIDGDTKNDNYRGSTNYNIEGAAIGYKWFEKTGQKPLFSFGHGLSYTSFSGSNFLAKIDNNNISTSFTIKNTGKKAGKAIAQVYASSVDNFWEAPRRLVGFNKISLKSGEFKKSNIALDPKLLAVYDTSISKYVIKAGSYNLTLANSTGEVSQTTTINLKEMVLN